MSWIKYCRRCHTQLNTENARLSRGRFVGICRACERTARRSVTLSISGEDYLRFEAVAIEQGKSLSALLRVALEQYLDRLPADT
jgi:hypothetical protein